MGQPDLAIATLNDFVEVSFSSEEWNIMSIFWLIRAQAGNMVASLNPRIPVIADADTG